MTLKWKCYILSFCTQLCYGCHYTTILNMSRNMRFPTMWYVRPAKPQFSLHICTVWSVPLLVAWIFYGFKATDWTSFGVAKLKRRLHRLVWVSTCQNATLLEITCHGSYVNHFWYIHFYTWHYINPSHDILWLNIFFLFLGSIDGMSQCVHPVQDCSPLVNFSNY